MLRPTRNAGGPQSTMIPNPSPGPQTQTKSSPQSGVGTKCWIPSTSKLGYYVPGAGWITFDPTNRSVGGLNLIPVAVARDISQCTPVSGSYFGVSDNFLSMDVTVSVTS